MFSHKNKILTAFAAIGLLSVGGTSTVANAQANAAQQQTSVTDQQLQEFAVAEAAVRQVQAQFQAQAESITSQAEASALQQQANEQMVQAIQQKDMSVDEYNQIANTIQANPEVQERYMELVQ